MEGVFAKPIYVDTVVIIRSRMAHVHICIRLAVDSNGRVPFSIWQAQIARFE